MSELINVANSIGFKKYNKEVFESLFRTYKGVGGNNEYLYSILVIYKKMFEAINDLSVEKQLKILEISTSISYETSINTLSEINKLDVKIESMDLKELNDSILELEGKILIKKVP